MEFYTKLLIISIIINITFCSLQCPASNSPPQEYEINEAKTIKQANFNGKTYNVVNIANKFFLTEDTYEGHFQTPNYGGYSNVDHCPGDFRIPMQSDYEEIIKDLGSNALSVFTDKNGFNMTEGNYYLTNTEGTDKYRDKMLLYIENNSLKFVNIHPNERHTVVRCMLNIPKFNLIAPFTERDIEFNEDITIKMKNYTFIIGYLWKIDENIFKEESFNYKFNKNGEHKLEFWGKYMNKTDIYFCEIIYVNKKEIASTQTYSESKIKVIKTDFEMIYEFTVHFSHSNCPISPRENGGYYIAFTDMEKYLHILSYDRNDQLIKDFNTNENAYPVDITQTEKGFAIYMIDANNKNHSYLSLYNKEFELVKTIQIMNNNKNDNVFEDSNLSKQIIKYNSDGKPANGIRFMYRPDNGKLLYSRGRIFLIFDHYNYFIKEGGHTGDTIVTFDDELSDMDFGVIWGASHSLIQTATFDKKYFWTASLSDAYPEGILVIYTSKRDFTKAYDPVNKKYNSRYYKTNKNLAGYIKGYPTGPSEGKLGGILYFEKYELYCLVYAKTPNYSDDPQKNNKTIIFITTWQIEGETIKNEQTYEIKIFNNPNENVMHLRAGRFGDDQIIIIYAETNQFGDNDAGRIFEGTIPKVFVIKVPSMTKIVNDKKYDNLLMNTNEDLRTFRDGVLIWGAADEDGNLVIHKIGTPTLLDDEENEEENTQEKNESNNEGKNEEIGEEKNKNKTNKEDLVDSGNNICSLFILITTQFILILEFFL